TKEPSDSLDHLLAGSFSHQRRLSPVSECLGPPHTAENIEPRTSRDLSEAPTAYLWTTSCTHLGGTKGPKPDSVPSGHGPGSLLVAHHRGDEAHRHPDGPGHQQTEKQTTHERAGHHGDEPVTGTADNG